MLEKSGNFMRTLIHNQLQINLKRPVHFLHKTLPDDSFDSKKVPFSADERIIFRQYHFLPPPYRQSFCRDYSRQAGCSSRHSCFERCRASAKNGTANAETNFFKCSKLYSFLDCDRLFFEPMQSLQTPSHPNVQTVDLIYQKESLKQEPKMFLSELISNLFGVVCFWFQLSVIFFYRLLHAHEPSWSRTRLMVAFHLPSLFKMIRNSLPVLLISLTLLQLHDIIDDYLNSELRSYSYIELSKYYSPPEISLCQPNPAFNVLRSNLTALDSQYLSQFFTFESIRQMLHLINQIVFRTHELEQIILSKEKIVKILKKAGYGCFENLCLRNFVYLNLNCIAIRSMFRKPVIPSFIFHSFLSLNLSQTNLQVYVHKPLAKFMSTSFRPRNYSHLSFSSQNYYEIPSNIVHFSQTKPGCRLSLVGSWIEDYLYQVKLKLDSWNCTTTLLPVRPNSFHLKICNGRFIQQLQNDDKQFLNRFIKREQSFFLKRNKCHHFYKFDFTYFTHEQPFFTIDLTFSPVETIMLLAPRMSLSEFVIFVGKENLQIDVI